MADNPRIEELRRRVLADPASIAFAALAEEYRRSGNYAEAIETCRVGLQRHPSYISARVTLGRALLETAQYGEARKELELVLKTAPENLAAIRGLAEIHERERSLPERAEINPVPLARQPLATSSAVATAPAPTIAVVKKTVADAGVSQWSLPTKAADPVSVRQPGPVITSPAAAPLPDPAIARLERFLVAIRSVRASSRISR
jgi:tetratricopeptide (TPR) repeat protein